MFRRRKWVYMFVDGHDKLGRSRTRKIKIPADQWLGNSGTNSDDTMMRNQNADMDVIENNPGSSESQMSGQSEDKFIDNFQFEDSSTEDSNYKKRKVQEANGWQQVRDDLIQVRIEGFSPASKNCSFCGCTDTLEIVWCPDCGPESVYCKRCEEKIHQVVKYHQSYTWKEDISLFVPVIRETILAHKHQCERMYYRQIRVFDAQGRHHVVKAQFCQCEPETLTLLRHNLWPSTPTRPETAFSLKLMELCRMLQLEGQLSLQKFCTALQRMTTFLPSHTSEFIDMYNAIGNALAEFHHHQMTCMEMAHVPDVMGKKCPICTMKPERSVISMDANFGLVHKIHSGCGPGLEHAKFNVFCPDDDVKTFVDSHHQATSKSGSPSVDCSNFQAGDILRSRNKNAKLDIRGVFGAVCHHGFPLHFVNMQHGERFGYPVYILKKIAEEQAGRVTNKKQIVMYDVACKLETHVIKHAELIGQLADKFRFVVPVFHSYAHNTKCQVEYGQRFCEGTGLIDGEATERLWSFLRRFSWSKEMTLPNRQDLLSSAILRYAQKIFSSTAEILHSRLKKAREKQAKSKDVIREVENKYKGTAVEWMHQLKHILLTPSSHQGVSGTDSLMEKARKLSIERQQLLCLKKRYADGQKIAMHLSKKLKANSTQLQAVANVLKDQGTDVSVAQLSDLDSPVYGFTPQGLDKEQVRAANCVVECCRAQEEEARILEDVNLFQQWLLECNRSLCPQSHAKPATKYERGMKHMKSVSKIQVEKELRGLVSRFSDLPELLNADIDFSMSNVLSTSLSSNLASRVNSHDPNEVTDVISDVDSDVDSDEDVDAV